MIVRIQFNDVLRVLAVSDDVPTETLGAWGKTASGGQLRHHLAHHSADVAAVTLVLLNQPQWRDRAAFALGRPLSPGETQCIVALAFLHDIGKLAPGFQAKGWPESSGISKRGHLECAWLWTFMPRAEGLSGAVRYLAAWPRIDEWLAALFSHHGRPVAKPAEGIAKGAFPVLPWYDWRAEDAIMGCALLDWFPAIATESPPPPDPAFVHFFCGLLTLADWVASDRRAFGFVPGFRADYWQIAQARASARVAAIGLGPCPALRVRTH